MNIDTGRIEMLPSMTDQEALLKRMIEIDEAEMTPEQKRQMMVSLHDHRSGLGKKITAILRAERNKYPAPHVGAKELAKRAARDSQNAGDLARKPAPQDADT